MGLSGRKTKQRIGVDPRNLTWADDAAKFGQSYLSKFGWDSSKGLGVEGDGRTSHIKVDHKLDMLGIGAAHQKDPNGIAWKQNKDFENLLKRLNAGISSDLPDEPAMNGFAAATADLGVSEAAVMEDSKIARKAEKKRRRKEDVEGKDESERKKRKKSKDKEEQAEVKETSPVVAEPARPFVPRHRAHRARAIAAKSIASKSASAISEILGIAPTPSSSTPSGSATPQGVLTPCNDGVSEKLTTSTKSVADYFKEKLLAKAKTAGTTTQAEHDPYQSSRGGLGSSRLRVEVSTETIDTETNRLGLSKFSSLMSSTFLSATTTAPTPLLELAPPEPMTEALGPDPTSKKRKNEGRKNKHEKKGSQQEVPDDATATTTPASAVPLDGEGGYDAKKRAKEERRREKAERKRKRQADNINDP
ncbi:hypothetical protein BD779DRAFT_958112 [Infundibulicybe gibba]|nr:hypothetical protein BD779DRAFT_958112 [Infundibulicybe gibba]